MNFPKITIIAPTVNGYRIATILQAGLERSQIWTKEDDRLEKVDSVYTYKGSIADCLLQLWQESSQIIFVLAVGATVRLIAPLLKDKNSDPGIVVVDETGRFVISLSGGHTGGADLLSRQVAALLDVEPIITSASEGENLPAIDLLGVPYGWQKGTGDWLGVAAAITQHQPVGVQQTCGWNLWESSLRENHPFVWQKDDRQLAAAIWISDQLPLKMTIPLVCWHPRTLWVGIGCERGIQADILEEALLKVLAENGLAWKSIAGLASVELKQDEVGLKELALKLDLPIEFFSAETLAAIEVPNPSSIVNRAVGTPSVAEAAAIEAAKAPLIVPKQVGDRMTIAIARSETEYNPRSGKIYLIGTGPGSIAQITPAAKVALQQADVIIGYQLYLDLIQPLLHHQQIIEASQITQEVQRAERSIALAKRGLTVAVISSGDCGIYGMAGLVLECLVRDDWDGKTPQVEVFPGITALQALAARVGAPLMHDFCAISLSDLLTPWKVILKRLEAAASADFVVALYNPRSRSRTEGIKIALEIFRQHRSPQTAVAIARSLYRTEEEVWLTTLEEIDVESIDMLTVVLIGNSNTIAHQNYLITPRGYKIQD
jgi:cobalt-precorrin 5A hydrolase/precorrin-3B C17-methyltransferase